MFSRSNPLMGPVDTSRAPLADAVATDRLTELDALRGIASLIVLLHHAAQVTPWARWWGEAPGLGSVVEAVLDHSPFQVLREGRQAVLFFFVLSGYVVVLGLRRSGSPGLAAFAAARTVRLLLPVAASVLLSLVLHALVFDAEVLARLRPHSLYTWWNPVTTRSVLMHLVLAGSDPDLRLNVVLWSLVHEWRTSVLLPLLLPFRSWPVVPVAFALALHAMTVFLGTPEDEVMLGWSVLRSFVATVYFALPVALGGALALAAPLSWPCRPVDRWAVALSALALFSLGSDLACFIGSMLVIALASQPGRFVSFLRHPFLAWLGRVSFSLYLVHTLVLVGALHALHDLLPLGAIALAGALASLPVAAAFHALVEQPSQSLARRVARRLRAPPGTSEHLTLRRP